VKPGIPEPKIAPAPDDDEAYRRAGSGCI